MFVKNCHKYAEADEKSSRKKLAYLLFATNISLQNPYMSNSLFLPHGGVLKNIFSTSTSSAAFRPDCMHYFILTEELEECLFAYIKHDTILFSHKLLKWNDLPPFMYISLNWVFSRGPM